ncbi:hypothetical protein FT663_04171 [Candidozyma haemuli var. vulneris]|uniref:Uncharacterized protein n=1 Tax=Candidozyma haemuli TaxID=45357 RepID=A0A2V1B1G5_9ASCO|nr:hypothetical protein CXQ85_004143 [[Candida] haemuloni]KAF3985769.1 hypothetical protein FT662_04946 [[Candida] haemuloni var. vulneris]KAF3988106.1 hypothetical protein FT663_04171 [[Candida] haemuloni var. vulneris]PVH23849.1 hypothetical protein CXQ85_004143 [[Candida] haemuloni]
MLRHNSLMSRRLMSQLPSHFSNPGNPPAPYGSVPNANADMASPQPISQSHSGQSMPPPNSTPNFPDPNRSSGARTLWDLLNFAATLGIAYYAYDNYVAKVKLEKVIKQTNAINAKAMQQQQQIAAKYKAQYEQHLREVSRASHRATFKMGVHISMLKKQLIDAGLDPVKADQAVEEYRQSVRSKVVNDVEYLWLDRSSPYSQLTPHLREYMAGLQHEKDDPRK